MRRSFWTVVALASCALADITFSDAETSLKFDYFECFRAQDLQPILSDWFGLGADGAPSDEKLVIVECGPYGNLQEQGFGSFGGAENLFDYWDTLNSLGIGGVRVINYKEQLGIVGGEAVPPGIFVNIEIDFGTTPSGSLNGAYEEYKAVVGPGYTDRLTAELLNYPDFANANVIAYHSAERQNSNDGENRPPPSPPPTFPPVKPPTVPPAGGDGSGNTKLTPSPTVENECPINRQSDSNEVLPLTCGTTLESIEQLRCLKPGESQVVRAPGRCDGYTAYGGGGLNNGYYTGLSSIAAAARHAGLFEYDYRFLVRSEIGLETYFATNGADGRMSSSYGACCDLRNSDRPDFCRPSLSSDNPNLYQCTQSFTLSAYYDECKNCVPTWLWIVCLLLALMLALLLGCMFCCQQEQRRAMEKSKESECEEPMPPSTSCGSACFVPLICLVGIGLLALFAYAIWRNTRKIEPPCQEPPSVCVTWWILLLLLLALLCLGLAALVGGSMCGDTAEPTYCTVSTECPATRPGYPENIVFQNNSNATPPRRSIALPQAPLSPFRVNPCEYAIERAADIRASAVGGRSAYAAGAAMETVLVDNTMRVQENVVYEGGQRQWEVEESQRQWEVEQRGQRGWEVEERVENVVYDTNVQQGGAEWRVDESRIEAAADFAANSGGVVYGGGNVEMERVAGCGDGPSGRLTRGQFSGRVGGSLDQFSQAGGASYREDRRQWASDPAVGANNQQIMSMQVRERSGRRAYDSKWEVSERQVRERGGRYGSGLEREQESWEVSERRPTRDEAERRGHQSYNITEHRVLERRGTLERDHSPGPRGVSLRAMSEDDQHLQLILHSVAQRKSSLEPTPDRSLP